MLESITANHPIGCDDAQDLLSAKIAVEISDGQHRQLANHLTDCAKCRLTERQWQSDDRMLNREFGAKKYVAKSLAGSVVEQLKLEVASLPELTVSQNSGLANSSVPSVAAQRRNLLTPALAIAVGFLLASVTFQPWAGNTKTTVTQGTSRVNQRRPTQPATPTLAQLVASTGPVRSKISTVGVWKNIDESKPFVCEPSTEIATGANARCEIMTVDGCIVRLNTNTQLVVETGRRVRVKQGQIWCRSSSQQPMEVVVDSGEHAANGDLPVYECPFGSVCMLNVAEPGLQAQAADGQVTLVTSRGSRVIDPGQSIMMTAAGQITAEDAVDPVLGAGWMDALLVRKSVSDPDLTTRVDALLNHIGESNTSPLYERELRNLGEHCVLPLTRYIQSNRSRAAPYRRLKAMAVVADVSPTWNIQNLIGLLNDEDGEVRVLAANALQRLTGESHGRISHEWREQPAVLDAVRVAWSEWWTNNSDFFPPLQVTNQRL